MQSELSTNSAIAAREMEKEKIDRGKERGNSKERLGEKEGERETCQLPQLLMVFSQEATVCTILVHKI